MPLTPFDSPEILSALQEATPEQFNALPFGVIQIDSKGKVLSYNDWESNLSGLKREDVIGRNYFIEVAPCTNNYMVAQKFLDADELDETLNYQFTFKLKPTHVTLRLLKSEKESFVLVKKTSDA